MSTDTPSPPQPLKPSQRIWLQRAWATYQQTITDNPWIPKLATTLKDGTRHIGPHLAQQRFLLHTYTLEALFGGAAGGGKSIAILAAAAQFVDVPGYAALLLRESFPHLNQPGALIARSKEWWLSFRHPETGQRAEWNSQARRWTFPSGATISFGYLERDDDVYQYQGSEYQFIGIDELTQHSEYRYTYLFSRLRKSTTGALGGVPSRMRATSNPGGRGHDWVKQRFISEATREPGAVFIPALLSDNPSVDADDYLRSLAHLDPITRAQLLKGDWDAHAGGRFSRDWLAATRYVYRPGLFRLGGRAYRDDEIKPRFLTVDPAASVAATAKSDPDYTVVSAWGVTPCGKLLWMGCRRERVEVPDIPPLVAAEYLRHGARQVVVESGGPQKGVCQALQRQTLDDGRFMSVREYNPSARGDKLSRATDAIILAEAGRLWIPVSAGDAPDPAFPLEEVEAELYRFTGDGKSHDDCVDTLSMAAERVAVSDDNERKGNGRFSFRALGHWSDRGQGSGGALGRW